MLSLVSSIDFLLSTLELLFSQQTFCLFSIFIEKLFSVIFVFTRLSSHSPRKHPVRGYKNKKEQNNFLWFMIFFGRGRVFCAIVFVQYYYFWGGEKMNITWIETVSKTWSREEKIFHFDVGVRREKLFDSKVYFTFKVFLISMIYDTGS